MPVLALQLRKAFTTVAPEGMVTVALLEFVVKPATVLELIIWKLSLALPVEALVAACSSSQVPAVAWLAVSTVAPEHASTPLPMSR